MVVSCFICLTQWILTPVSIYAAAQLGKSDISVVYIPEFAHIQHLFDLFGEGFMIPFASCRKHLACVNFCGIEQLLIEVHHLLTLPGLEAIESTNPGVPRT